MLGVDFFDWILNLGDVRGVIQANGHGVVDIHFTVRSGDLIAIGFDPAQPIIGDHMGQRTMQERAAALGGACRVQSSPGEGTTIIVTIPVTSEQNELDL